MLVYADVNLTGENKNTIKKNRISTTVKTQYHNLLWMEKLTCVAMKFHHNERQWKETSDLKFVFMKDNALF
jgi:hypothetical protein